MKNGHDTGRRKRPTLQTISEITGFARTTVSRALGDAPDIAEQTKQTVRRVAREIGYAPDPAGVKLRTGRTHMVSLVLRLSRSLMGQQTSALIHELSRAFSTREHRLIVTPWEATDEPLVPVQFLVNSGAVDGLILNRTRPDDARVQYLSEIGFPFVTHGRTDCGVPHPSFDFDNHAFGRLTAQMMVRRGRKTILLVQPPIGETYSQALMAGVRQGIEGTDAKLFLLEGCDGDAEPDVIHQALRKQFERQGLPQAIVTCSSVPAVEALVIARELGHTPGATFDLVCKEIEPLVSKCFPGAISLSENIPLAADFLCDALLHAIENPGAKPMQGLETPTQLVRSTLGPGFPPHAPLKASEDK